MGIFRWIKMDFDPWQVDSIQAFLVILTFQHET